MKKKINRSTCVMKIVMERMPTTIGLVVPSHSTTCASGIQGSGFQPPRNSRVNTPEPITMCEYSATKKSPNLKAPYSVWNPPTKSDSDSGMSNGCRLVSANNEVRKMKADTGMMNPNQTPPQLAAVNPCQSPLWNSITRANPIEASIPGAFTQRNTGTTDSVIESSYEISCAEARTPPRN